VSPIQFVEKHFVSSSALLTHEQHHLQRKIEEHDAHVRDCKNKSAEIRDIFARRQARYARGGSGGAGRPGEVVDMERRCGRMRHALAALKASLAHDRAQLSRLEEGAVRHARLAQALRRQQLTNGSGGGGSGWGEEEARHFVEEEVEMLGQAAEELQAVLEDLESVLEGAARPAGYPIELVEQVRPRHVLLRLRARCTRLVA
jgi:hypothetical protein